MSNSEDTMQSKQQRRSLSMRARLIIGIMILVGVSLIVVLGVTFLQRQQLTNFITTLVNQEVKQQAENLLTKTLEQSSNDANEFFEVVADDAQTVTNYIANLYGDGRLINTNNYWNAEESLTRFGENQWGNSANDPGSVFAPSSFELTEETAAEINTTILLDFIAPQALNASSELKALYFINNEGVVQYYPNIDMANVVGDFDVRQRPYFKAVTPELNPDKEPFWTVPYYDAADGSVIETHSLPVYDEQGIFRGALAANVDISTVTTLVENLEVGKTGYAFLIDPGGRFIALPEAALVDFGLGQEALPEGGVAQSTIFNTEDDIRAFATKMIAGETGLGTFTRDSGERYLAYAPIEATGYSLGLVVPVDEMIQLYLTVQQNVDAQESQTLLFSYIAFIVILLISLVFAYIIGRVLTRPLQQLTDAAEEISAGNYDVEIDTSYGGEVGTLAVAFDGMTHQVRDMVGTLEQRVADRTRALEASMEVSRSVSTILDQRQLVSEVVEQVRNAFDYYHVHIYTVDENTNDLVLAGGTGEAGQALLGGGHKIAYGKGLVGRAATTRTTVLVSDIAEEADWLPNLLLPDTKTEIAIPMVIDDQLFGVLDVQQDTVGSLTEIDAQLLESVANQVSIALRNARLYEGAQTQARREAVVNSIGQKLQTAADIESVLQIAAQELGKALNSQRATVQLSTVDQGENGHQ